VSFDFEKLQENEARYAMFLLYEKKVRKETEKSFRKVFLQKKHLRGQDWVLDHKMSIFDCFNCQVPVSMAAHVCNLEMIPKEENLRKGRKSTLNFGELIQEITEYEEINATYPESEASDLP
jgi:hypothetical protein